MDDYDLELDARHEEKEALRKEVTSLRAQLAETHKQLTDQLCDNNQLIAEKVNQGAELLAAQEKLKEAEKRQAPYEPPFNQ